ncbi:MAG: hypothetical protein ABIR18_09175 [Chitinophagaceae bacterium]
MLKKLLKILLWVIGCFTLLAGIIYLVAWKSPLYYIVSKPYNPADSIIPFSRYNEIINHPRPFIITLKNKYTIFGSVHTRDPKHIEIKLIEEEWKKLSPTVALIEGRLDFLLPWFMDPVKNLGEAGKVKELASEDNITVYNWDLSKEILAKQLLQKFTAEQIALAQVLNPYFGHLRFGKPSSPESYVESFLKRAKYVDQESNFKTVADIDRIWRKYFPAGKDWRDTDDQYGLPGFLDKIAIFNNDLRNRQLVAAVKELTAKGERVFLTCGSSHAACISTAFRDTISNKQ